MVRHRGHDRDDGNPPCRTVIPGCQLGVPPIIANGPAPEAMPSRANELIVATVGKDATMPLASRAPVRDCGAAAAVRKAIRAAKLSVG